MKHRLEQGERIWLRGVYRTGLGFLLAGIKKKLSTPMVVVVPNDEDARVLFNDMKEFLPERAFYLPSCDFLYESPESTAYEETLNERITSLYILTQTRTSPLVIVPLRSFLQRMVSLKDFNGSVINFKVGEHKRRKLMEGLARLGYERKDIYLSGCHKIKKRNHIPFFCPSYISNGIILSINFIIRIISSRTIGS